MKNLTKKLLFVITIFKITSSYFFGNIEWGDRNIGNDELQRIIEQSTACPVDLFSPFTEPKVFNVIMSVLADEGELNEGEKRILHYKKVSRPIAHVIVTVSKVNNRIEIIEEKLYERTALVVEEEEGEVKEDNVKTYRKGKKIMKRTILGKRRKGEITKEYVSVLSEEIVKLLFEGQDPFAMYRNMNGIRLKEVNTNYTRLIRFAGAYNNILKIFNVISRDNNSELNNFICNICEQGDNIISFKSTRNNYIQTTVRYRDGSWFHAVSINDTKERRIIMGFHNHENDISQFNRKYSGNELTVESGLFTSDEALFSINAHGYTGGNGGGFIANDVRILYRLGDGRTHLKLYKNFGVIILTDAILVNSYYYPCEDDPAFTYWLRSNFQKVKGKSVKHDENFGFLVYTTPEGEMYRTSNSEFIEQYVYNENDQLPHNCCMTSYTGIINDQLITMKKNYGIIENGKPIKKSRYIIDHGTAMEYASPDSSVNIKWNKVRLQ